MPMRRGFASRWTWLVVSTRRVATISRSPSQPCHFANRISRFWGASVGSQRYWRHHEIRKGAWRLARRHWIGFEFVRQESLADLAICKEVVV